AKAGAYAELALPRGIPGEPEARAEVVPVAAVCGPAKAFVAGKHQTDGSRWKDRRLLARAERVYAVTDLDDRSAVIVAQANVHREIAGDLKVVLGIGAEKLVAETLLVSVRLVVEPEYISLREIINRRGVRIPRKAGNHLYDASIGSIAADTKVPIVDKVEDLEIGRASCRERV